MFLGFWGSCWVRVMAMMVLQGVPYRDMGFLEPNSWDWKLCSVPS